MRSWQKLTKSIVLLVWSLLLTSMTVVLGAVPLKGLRSYVGKLVYWGLGFLVTASLVAVGWPVLGVTIGALFLLIGIFADLEEAGHSYLSASAFSLIITSLLGAGGFAFWISEVGASWYMKLIGLIEPPLQEAMSFTQGVQLEAETLVVQAPSIVVILLMVALYVTLLLEPRLNQWLGKPQKKKRHLSNFRLPDASIWLFVLSLLGAFAEYDIRWLQVVSVNLFHVSILLFFFQGLAVIAKCFRLMKVGPFWQVLWFSLLILQLFLVVSMVGLADYWLDFRARLIRKVAQMKKENV